MAQILFNQCTDQFDQMSFISLWELQILNGYKKLIQESKTSNLLNKFPCYNPILKNLLLYHPSNTQMDVLPIGQIVFSDRIAKEGKMGLVSDDILETLQSETWLIKNGKYRKQNWKLIVPFIKELKAHQIIFFNNPEPSLLKEISSINFLQLKWLFLRKNQINNIEAITWLSAPHLQKLILSNNEFISVKPLQKLNQPMLSQIHINGNPFKKVPLDRIRMHNSVQCLALQEEETDRIVACDLSSYAKTNFNKLDLIQIQGSKRIKQPKVRASLEQKFGFIRLTKNVPKK